MVYSLYLLIQSDSVNKKPQFPLGQPYNHSFENVNNKKLFQIVQILAKLILFRNSQEMLPTTNQAKESMFVNIYVKDYKCNKQKTVKNKCCQGCG